MRTMLAKVCEICKVSFYETVEEMNNSKVSKFLDKAILYLANIILILSVICFILK